MGRRHSGVGEGMTAAYDPHHDWSLEDRADDLAVGTELAQAAASVNPQLAAKVRALFAVSDYEVF